MIVERGIGLDPDDLHIEHRQPGARERGPRLARGLRGPFGRIDPQARRIEAGGSRRLDDIDRAEFRQHTRGK